MSQMIALAQAGKGGFWWIFESSSLFLSMRVFDIPTLAQFYFITNNKDYEQMKAYIRTLDYLRLLIIEYLHLSTSI